MAKYIEVAVLCVESGKPSKVFRNCIILDTDAKTVQQTGINCLVHFDLNLNNIMRDALGKCFLDPVSIRVINPGDLFKIDPLGKLFTFESLTTSSSPMFHISCVEKEKVFATHIVVGNADVYITACERAFREILDNPDGSCTGKANLLLPGLNELKSKQEPSLSSEEIADMIASIRASATKAKKK